MLFVRREDQVVQDFAARNGGVVAQHGIDQAGAVFEVAVVAQHKTGGHYRVEDMATVAGDAVDQNDTLADLRWLFLGGVDGDILELAGTFDVAVWTDLGILQDPAVLDDRGFADGAIIAAVLVEGGVGDVEQALLQRLIVDVFRPQVGVGVIMPSKGRIGRPPFSFITSSHTRTSSGSPSLMMPLPNLEWSVVLISWMLKRIHLSPMM